MKLSFDFDDCLDNECVQEIVKELVGIFDVEINTNRPDRENWNKDIQEVCDRLGIKKVNYLDGGEKYKFLNDQYIFHLDDDKEEIDEINLKSRTIGIYFDPDGQWVDEIFSYICRMDKKYIDINERLKKLFPYSELRWESQYVATDMIVAWDDATRIQPRIYFYTSGVRFEIEVNGYDILNTTVNYEDIDVAFESFMLILEEEMNHRKQQQSRANMFPNLEKEIRQNKLKKIVNI